MEEYQKQNFEDRIAKIGSQKAESGKQKKRTNSVGSNLLYPLSILGAFGVGILSIFLARYIRFHLGIGGIAEEDAGMMMVADIAIGFMVGFLFKQILRFKSQEFHKAQAAGIFVAVCTMHNLVHATPATFDKLLSPEWTDMVVSSTEPKSILFGGMSFLLGDPEERQGTDEDGLGSQYSNSEDSEKPDIRVNQLPQVR